MSRPILSGRLAKWSLLLSEFEINFVLQRAIKGQALSNFLADHPVLAKWELTEEFPDEDIFLVEVLPPWEMYFDGAARRNGAGAGVLFISPRRDLLPYSFILTQKCLNNEAEYQAILLRLGMAVEMKLSQLNIYGDSALVIKQLIGEFEVKKPELVPFRRHAGELLAQIPEASLHNVPRSENGSADALAGIVASLAQFDERPSQVPICERWIIPPPIEEETEEEQTEEGRISSYLGQPKHNGRLARAPHKLPLPRHTPCRPARASPDSPSSSKRHTVEFAAHTKLARSFTYKSSDWAITGHRCSETPSKWLELANNANSTSIIYTRHWNRFTQRSQHGHLKLGGWTSLASSLLNPTPTSNTSWLPPITSQNGPKLLPTKK
ncbi:hypothetical protein H6P81_018434 [Aristolochia fimbriata]|uniref:RNase H type-1 domain-containing protein n=1 Tax=Aristolochia fimbriata TaxID=158543 RepID=A0AAV7E134_ARIFI|nr:hypothetical protein H6P81_018434 [Aristolochia fimbriata]